MRIKRLKTDQRRGFSQDATAWNQSLWTENVVNFPFPFPAFSGVPVTASSEQWDCCWESSNPERAFVLV